MKKKMIKYLCLALVLFGCSKYTPDDAIKDMNKANRLQPKAVADYVGDKFPCTPKTDSITKIDTMYQYMDVICPPSDTISNSDTIYLRKNIIKKDTIRKYIAIPTKKITIIKYVEDSAKIKSLSIANSQTLEELKKCSDKKDKNSEWIKWLIICLAISIIANLIQLK